MRVSGRPGRTDPVVGRPVRTPSGLAGRRPAWPDAGRPGRPWPEWCVPGWPVVGLWFTIDPKNDMSQKRPERAARLNSGVFTFWISYVGQAGLWSDWRAGGRPVVGLAGRGRPPAGLVGRWPAWPDAVRRGWTASGVVGSSRPPVCTSLLSAVLVSYTASLSCGFEQSDPFLRSFEHSDLEERHGDASWWAQQQATPGGSAPQCAPAAERKRPRAQRNYS